jgi:tRNA(Ile)-lysidine synthase
MANSRNSAPADAVGGIQAALASALAEHVPATASIAVALSGGIDSMVLLDALAPLAQARAIAFSAIHVNHGISPHAPAWAAFCAEQCASRGITLSTIRLALGPGHRANLEAVARHARYRALRSAQVDVVALAHQVDDQAETVLLQLLRGAGPRGLSAMPRYQPGTPALWRPLLDLTRAALAAYACERGLAWIDDESNANTRYKRNLLRHDISSRLAAHFPGYPATVARAAEHQAEASGLLDTLAMEDAAIVAVPGGLDCARLTALAPARARNLLRWYLREQGLRSPSTALLGDMLRQLVAARPDAHTRIEHDSAAIGCHRGLVVVHASPPSPLAFACTWHGEPELPFPGGTLSFERVQGNGIAAAQLALHPVTLRSRAGGERLQLAANRPRRALKKMLQDTDMPPWQRQTLPLVWCGDRLAAVPGIGVDLAFQAARDEPGWAITWQPASGRPKPLD